MSGSSPGGLSTTPNMSTQPGEPTQAQANTVAGASPASEQEVYEMMADFWVKNLKNLREALDDHLKGLAGTERQKVAKIREQVDKHLKALEDNKRKGGLNTLMKILGPVLTALSIAVAVLVPTPMTIAMATVAVAMFLEPMISKAAGQDSLIEQGMGELMEEMTKYMPPEAAAVVTAIIVTVAVVMLTCGLAAGLSAVGSAVGTSAASATAAASKASTAASGAAKSAAIGTSPVAGSSAGTTTNVSRTLTQTLLKGMGITPQHSKFEAVAKVLEYVETLLSMAQAGVQMDIAVVNFELAKALKEFNIDQAHIDQIGALINMIWTDVGNTREHMENLLNLLSELFDRQAPHLEFI